jgi:phytase-like protein
VKKTFARFVSIAFTFVLFAALSSQAQIRLLAVGTLDRSRAGVLTDLSGLNYNLENGAAASLLGGFGSAITYDGGSAFLALPDRGPNAVPYDSGLSDTVSYINRFHTVNFELSPKNDGGLPFTLNLSLRSTTLLWSPTALVYGTGDTIVGSGAPALNTSSQFFFTGRSDNFDSSQNSGNPADARFDTEGIRLSNDGLKVYISDEYGPYVYEFDRLTGQRLRSFQLPSSFYVTTLSSNGAVEISSNAIGRVANKGMEGLAITPDGTTLVGIMQNSLEQDAAQKGAAAKMLRIVTIDIASGTVTHQYAYGLTTGTGVSEILALNNQEFLVDERDGKGRGDGSSAKVKTLFKISLANATDVSAMDGLTAASHEVTKTSFLDLVGLLNSNGIASGNIPAKIEGISFGPDVKQGKINVHTLWIANDNDFLPTVADANGNQIPNPNQFFVVGFTDADLSGSVYAPQQVTPLF